MISALLCIAASLPPFTIGYTPPFHGAPCTQYAGFESFNTPVNGPNFPDDPATTDLGAAVWQLMAGGVITSAGNLDDLTLPPSYRVTDSTPSDAQEVVLQVSGLLNPIPFQLVQLEYFGPSGLPISVIPTSSYYLVHQMGHDERVMTWDLSAIPDTITSFQIEIVTSNTFTTLDAVKLDVRYACFPGSSFCSPGIAGVIACPCSNPPSGQGRGCDNSSLTGGATLDALGVASLGADSVQFTSGAERPNATTVLLQGNASIASGAVFGQGVRCVGGGLKRLYVRAAVGGSISVPQAGDPQVSAQSATLGDPISAGQQRYYMAYYRDPIVLGACSALSTFNGTTAIDVLWTP